MERSRKRCHINAERVSRRPMKLMQATTERIFIAITSDYKRVNNVGMIRWAFAAQGRVLHTFKVDVANRGDGSSRTMINVVRQFALTWPKRQGVAWWTRQMALTDNRSLDQRRNGCVFALVVSVHLTDGKHAHKVMEE
jgi:hypothetical protein